MATLKQIHQEMDAVMETAMTMELVEEQKKAVALYYNELKIKEAEKVDAVVSYIRGLQTRSEAIKAEAKRLLDEAKSLDSQAIRITDFFKGHLMTRPEGERKLKGNVYSMAIRTMPAVQIDDERLIPGDFMRVKFETSPDKVAIKKAIQDGQEIAGARIVQNLSLILK